MKLTVQLLCFFAIVIHVPYCTAATESSITNIGNSSLTPSQPSINTTDDAYSQLALKADSLSEKVQKIIETASNECQAQAENKESSKYELPERWRDDNSEILDDKRKRIEISDSRGDYRSALQGLQAYCDQALESLTKVSKLNPVTA